MKKQISEAAPEMSSAAKSRYCPECADCFITGEYSGHWEACLKRRRNIVALNREVRS